MSQLVSEPYEYNTSLMVIFSKTYSDDTLRYLTIVVLTGGKLIGIYFSHLLSLTTHRWQGKKVRILPSGDVDPGPIPSRWGLLEDSPYHAVGVAVRRATSHDRAPSTCGDLGVSCGDLHKAWICSCNECSAIHTVQCYPCSVKRVGALGG
jgi:hypothetical protein